MIDQKGYTMGNIDLPVDNTIGRIVVIPPPSIPRCATCKHWVSHEAAGYCPELGRYLGAARGIAVVTGPAFGCALHETKE
jgi:hypothetical protein